MQLSRSLSGLTNLLFNGSFSLHIQQIFEPRGTVAPLKISRNLNEVPNTKRKGLKPGKVSPYRPVADHISSTPYVNSQQPTGIASGPEVRDDEGIECVRASGRLAAQVPEYAGTLGKDDLVL